MMTGSPLPSLILFAYSWSRVDSAANTRDTWIRRPISTFPPALFAAFATRIAGVTQPTTAASTCWAASGNTCPNDGLPSHLNNSALSLFCLVSFIVVFPFLSCIDSVCQFFCRLSAVGHYLRSVDLRKTAVLHNHFPVRHGHHHILPGHAEQEMAVDIRRRKRCERIVIHDDHIRGRALFQHAQFLLKVSARDLRIILKEHLRNL